MNLCSHVRMKLIGFKLKFPINAFLPSFKVTTDSWVLFFRFNCVLQTSENTTINNRFHKRNVKNYLIKSRVQLQLHCGALKHTGTSIQLFEVVTNHFIIYTCLFYQTQFDKYIIMCARVKTNQVMALYSVYIPYKSF